jgi:ribosomal protein S18 acetylase RimI-like enzyme
MHQVIIRPAAAADRDRLIQGMVDQQEYERALHDTRLPGAEIAEAYLGHVLTRTKEQQGALLVAEVVGDFAGFVACWVEQDDNIAETQDSNRFGYVADTYVLPEFRGHGIAGHLLQAAEAHLWATGVRRMRIGLLTNNSSALRAYQKHGFEPYETVLEKRLRTTP